MMDIEQSSHGDVTVLAPRGRLTMVSAPQFKQVTDEVVAKGNERVVIDLSAVTFIDSSGLGALIGGLKRARQAAGDLRVAGAKDQVDEVFQLMNLDRIMRPYPTVDAALGDW